VGHNLRDCHIIVASLHDMSLQLQGDMMLLFGPYIHRVYFQSNHVSVLINNRFRVSQEYVK
jgi:hypothetical protein